MLIKGTSGDFISSEMSREQVAYSSPQNESANVEPEDRLGSLPEDLRKHILCMLPIQDAVRTCILSKSWRCTYKSLRNLVFDSSEFTDAERRHDHFVEFIGQTLLHHDDSDIQAIKFKLWRERAHITLKIEWIDLALRHNVEDLFIEACHCESRGFGSCVFSSSSLKRFTFWVGLYFLRSPTSIFLPNLKELRLGGVVFTNDDLTRELFSSCPLLEYVKLWNCNMSFLRVLNISALKLNYLFLHSCSGLESIEINLHTPSLVSLLLRGSLAQNYHIGDCPSIKFVCIRVGEVYRNQRRSMDILSHTVFKLLAELRKVTELAVDNLFWELLFYKASNSWAYANAICFHNLRKVYLSVWPSKKHIQMILILLSRMPNVRTAYFYMRLQQQASYLSTLEWNSENLQSVGMPNSLNHVYIKMFVGDEVDICLAKVFLENAKALVKLTISISLSGTESVDGRKSKFIEKLLAFPRASPNAVVVVL